MKKKYLIVLLLIVVVFSSCTSKKAQDIQEEMRIVSLSPNITEIICELGLKDCLVGRTDACDRPQSVQDVTVVGTPWMPDLETVVSLQPTIVLASSLTDPQSLENLEKAGLNIKRIVFEESLEGTYSLIESIGTLLGMEDKAKEISSSQKERIENVQKKVSQVKDKKSCIYIISWGAWGDYAATGNTFLSDIINAAGGINAAEEATGWAISQELLVSQDPDVILLPSYSYAEADIQGFTTTAPYSQLNGMVVTINGDNAERQGIGTAQTVESIAKILYPELF